MQFDIKKVLEIIPHRYPMLLVDRIVKFEEDFMIGEKCVTINEPFFQGHFPGHPIMPGVLVIEAMAQVGGFLLLKRVKDPADKVVYFIRIDKVRFRKPVLPGDVLRSELKLLKYREGLCVMSARAYVGKTLVAEGEFTAKVMKR
ncbi:3-hydroxyacyl-ACP dehydratase FabZ [candidate division WOR-3 bacterium]|nr:3-hydroxyacyl-ACP dehydratase FabZ [candidate division WOR-3 bacterium]